MSELMILECSFSFKECLFLVFSVLVSFLSSYFIKKYVADAQ